MPHHLGKAVSAGDVVRRSGLAWTILQPGAYLQNLDLRGTRAGCPYDVQREGSASSTSPTSAPAAATVLLDDAHVGATYELASRVATVAELAAEAGVAAEQIGDPELRNPWLSAMFADDDRRGLPVGTLPLRALLGRTRRRRALSQPTSGTPAPASPWRRARYRSSVNRWSVRVERRRVQPAASRTPPASPPSAHHCAVSGRRGRDRRRPVAPPPTPARPRPGRLGARVRPGMQVRLHRGGPRAGGGLQRDRLRGCRAAGSAPCRPSAGAR